MRGVSLDDKQSKVDVSFPNIFERDFFGPSEICDYESKHIKSSVLLDQGDAFYDMLIALETNFNLGEKGSPGMDTSASVSTT